jgi:hypothetical protein
VLRLPAAAARRRIIRQASGWLHRRCGPVRCGTAALAVLDDAGRVDVIPQRLGQRVMARHGVLFATFFVQPHRPAGAARPQVFDLHLQGRGDPCEGVGECGNQSSIA